MKDLNSTTEIVSNGSKWNGQEPDSIEKLIEVLKTHKLDSDMFMYKFKVRRENSEPKKYTQCFITKEKGMYLFFGNFETLSHVFRIFTNDLTVISQLKTAIMLNEGWSEGVKNLKRKIN